MKKLLLCLLLAGPALAKPQTPSLQFSVPCLEVKQSPGKPPDLLSLFYELPFARFPIKSDFVVVNGWSQGQGNFQQSMRLLKPDKKLLVDTGPQPFTLTSTQVPFMAVNEFQEILFDKPGVYWFEVYLDKRKISAYPVPVRRTLKP